MPSILVVLSIWLAIDALIAWVGYRLQRAFGEQPDELPPSFRRG